MLPRDILVDLLSSFRPIASVKPESLNLREALDILDSNNLI